MGTVQKMSYWEVVAQGNLLEGFRWCYIVYRTKSIPRNPHDILRRWYSEYLFPSSEDALKDFEDWRNRQDYDVIISCKDG